MRRITDPKLDILLTDFFKLDIFDKFNNLQINITKNTINITLNLQYFNNFFNKLNSFFSKYQKSEYEISLSITNSILFEVNILIDNIEFDCENEYDYIILNKFLQRMVLDNKSEFYLDYEKFIEFFNIRILEGKLYG